MIIFCDMSGIVYYYSHIFPVVQAQHSNYAKLLAGRVNGIESHSSIVRW